MINSACGGIIAALLSPFGRKRIGSLGNYLKNSSAEARGKAPSEAGKANFTTWLAKVSFNSFLFGEEERENFGTEGTSSLFNLEHHFVRS